MTRREGEAPSDAARRIEDKLLKETGGAHGDPDKPVQEKFDELGEQDTVKKPARRP